MPDKVTTLGSLSGAGLLGSFVIAANEFSSCTFNFNNAEACSESVSNKGSFLVEEIVKACEFKTSVLLVNFRKNNGVGWDGLSEFSLVLLPVINNL